MVTAMEQANLEPVIIEDSVKFGEDRGQLKEARATLRRVLALRKLGLKADGEARINACTDLAMLQRWLDQAVLAATADEVLQQPPPASLRCSTTYRSFWSAEAMALERTTSRTGFR